MHPRECACRLNSPCSVGHRRPVTAVLPFPFALSLVGTCADAFRRTDPRAVVPVRHAGGARSRGAMLVFVSPSSCAGRVADGVWAVADGLRYEGVSSDGGQYARCSQCAAFACMTVARAAPVAGRRRAPPIHSAHPTRKTTERPPLRPYTMRADPADVVQDGRRARSPPGAAAPCAHRRLSSSPSVAVSKLLRTVCTGGCMCASCGRGPRVACAAGEMHYVRISGSSAGRESRHCARRSTLGRAPTGAVRVRVLLVFLPFGPQDTGSSRVVCALVAALPPFLALVSARSVCVGRRARSACRRGVVVFLRSRWREGTAGPDWVCVARAASEGLKSVVSNLTCIIPYLPCNADLCYPTQCEHPGPLFQSQRKRLTALLGPCAPRKHLSRPVCAESTVAPGGAAGNCVSLRDRYACVHVYITFTVRGQSQCIAEGVGGARRGCAHRRGGARAAVVPASSRVSTARAYGARLATHQLGARIASAREACAAAPSRTGIMRARCAACFAFVARDERARPCMRRGTRSKSMRAKRHACPRSAAVSTHECLPFSAIVSIARAARQRCYRAGSVPSSSPRSGLRHRVWTSGRATMARSGCAPAFFLSCVREEERTLQRGGWAFTDRAGRDRTPACARGRGSTRMGCHDGTRLPVPPSPSLPIAIPRAPCTLSLAARVPTSGVRIHGGLLQARSAVDARRMCVRHGAVAAVQGEEEAARAASERDTSEGGRGRGKTGRAIGGRERGQGADDREEPKSCHRVRGRTRAARRSCGAVCCCRAGWLGGRRCR